MEHATINQACELVKKARSGDAEAFGELYSGIWHDLYKYALMFLQNEQDAKDAVQQTALEAFCGIKKLGNPERFNAWMFAILSRQCKKFIPELVRRRQTGTLEELELTLAEPGDAEQLAEAKEAYAAICAFPPDDRQILLLRLAQGYSCAEIAGMLRRPAGSVRSRLSRALAKLRVTLGSAD